MEWTLLKTAGAATRLNARYDHAMAAVGTFLYLHGGNALIVSDQHLSDELFVRTADQTFVWPLPGGLSSFTRMHDGDLIKGTTATDLPSANQSDWEVVQLCSQPFLPCFLNMEGTIHRHMERIVCRADAGCTGITVKNAILKCNKNTRAPTGPLQISGAGAVLRIMSSTFLDCVSLDDGGSIRAWDGADVTISESTFANSSSQVLSMSCRAF